MITKKEQQDLLQSKFVFVYLCVCAYMCVLLCVVYVCFCVVCCMLHVVCCV